MTPGVESRLAATRLPFRYHYFDADALDDPDGGKAHARIQVIDEAGHQQLHGPRPRRVRSSHVVKLIPAGWIERMPDGLGVEGLKAQG